jgi:hypothetical protein
LPRRPDPFLVRVAIADAVIAAAALGPAWPLWIRAQGLFFTLVAVRNWRRYWRAHDAFERWRRGLGR